MSRRTVGVVVAIWLYASGPVDALGAISFADDRARARYEAYAIFLERDPHRFASAIATVRRLERSDVEYRFTTGGAFEWNVEGSLTTDGERVYVNIADRGAMSRNSRIAHELEHARQFDDGEIAFERDPRTGGWVAHRASYDIGDEVKAWSVQLNASIEEDFWRRPEGGAWRLPSLLGEFAEVESDEARARLLAERGYGELARVPNSHVAFARSRGYGVGQLLRGHLFGRVRTVH